MFKFQMNAERRIAKALCRGLIAAVMTGMVLAALSHDVELLRASQSSSAYPTMIYGAYATPGTGAAGVDFDDIFMSAQALAHGEPPYQPTTAAFKDPFGRPKNYPPLMYWLYVPLTRLAFWPALIVHTIFSLLAVICASAFLLWKTGLRRYIGLVLGAQACLFFLTPVGVTHFERGQFDLLVAATVALCFACSFVKRGLFALAIVVGIAGALKWTSLPFLGCFSVFGFLLSSGPRRWAFFVLPIMSLLATVVFWHDLQEYWKSIRYFDLDASPYGITMRHFLPALSAKAVPIAITLVLGVVIWVRARSASERFRLFLDTGAPLALVLTNLAICFPAVSYEYHTVTTLGMLPVLVIWTELSSRVPSALKAATCALYGVFLVVAFRIVDQFVNPSPLTMTIIYMIFSGLFFGICVFIAFLRAPRDAETETASSDPSAGIGLAGETF